MSDIILVKLKHVRECGFCSKGLKTYCTEKDVDWRRFKDGIPVDELSEYNTTEFNAVVKAAKRDHNGK